MSNFKHGHCTGGKVSPEYNSYCAMLDRCLREDHPRFPEWGGKGITVCDRWVESFENFLEDMGPRPKGHTLDREDGLKGYSPDNCRWATPTQQAHNRNYKKEAKSGKRGVSWSEKRGMFSARIGVCGKNLWLGWFTSLESAVTARKGAELKYYGKVLS